MYRIVLRSVGVNANATEYNAIQIQNNAFMKTKLTLFTILLLTLACQRQKQPFFVQDSVFHAKMDNIIGSFNINEENCSTVIQEGEKTLVLYKDSLCYDSIGWSKLHHRLAIAYRYCPNDDSTHSKMKTNFEAAIALRTLIPSKKKDLANSYINLGIGENQYGNYKDAIEPLKKALDFYTQKEDTARCIGVRRELLKAYSELDEHDLTEKYFKSTEQYYNGINLPSDAIQREYAGVLHYYGDFLNKTENYQSAIKYFAKTQQLFEKLGFKDDKAIVNLKLSFAQMENEQNSEAIATVNSTIPFFQSQKDSTNLAQCYTQLSQCYLSQKNYPKALFYSEQKALPILLNQQDKTALGNCYLTAAIAYFENGDNQNTLKNSQKALQSYLIDFKSDEVAKNPSEQELKNYQAKSALINVFLQKAKTLSKFAIQTESTTYLENSWQTYQILNGLIALIREDILTENSKIDLGEKQDWVADALNVAKQLFAKTNNLKYQEEAYALVQNTKAQVINEHFQGEKGKKIANVSKEDSDKERELFAKYSNLNKKQLDYPNDKALEDKALLAELRFYDFQKVIENKYPLYRQSKYDHKALTVKEIQERLKPNMAALDYMVTKDSLHIFCINKQRLTWKTISLDGSQKASADTLKKLLNDPNGEMKTPQSKQFLDCSHRLYQSLVQPIANELMGVTRLRIISDDWIYNVSFQSLCMKPYLGDWSNKEVPFLIRNFAISRLFSVKELKPIAPKQSNSKVSVGSFGINYNDDKIFSSSRSSDSCLRIMAATRGGGKLYHAAEEADSVHAIWGIGDCFLNDKATKNNFIKNCQSKDYSILHLAMHGIPECDNPEKIQLIFAKNSATEDNLMHLHEIAGLKMHSDLAVISACHSGDGQLENKEGIISLGRAFTMAGCRSLITSNSYVNDYTSPMIFKYFYNNLKDNDLEKDIALQKAICSYLDNKGNTMRLPYRWANFHLWGDVDSIKTSEKESFFSFNWLMTLLGISGIGLFLWFSIYYNAPQKLDSKMTKNKV